MSAKTKKFAVLVHDQAALLFPSIKLDLVRRINRHPKLSNALRKTVGINAIDNALDEPTIGMVTAVKLDSSRLAKKALVTSAKHFSKTHWVRTTVLPMLDRTPRLRDWLRKIVLPAPLDGFSPEGEDIQRLSKRGLMVYGLLVAYQQRGED